MHSNKQQKSAYAIYSSLETRKTAHETMNSASASAKDGEIVNTISSSQHAKMGAITDVIVAVGVANTTKRNRSVVRALPGRKV